MKIASLKCPKENSGCGQSGKWRIAVDREWKRLALECTKCGYRMSFPLDLERMSEWYTGPLDETGKSIQQ